MLYCRLHINKPVIWWKMVMFIFFSILVVFVIRIVWLLFVIRFCGDDNILSLDKQTVRTLLCVGSGGHTSELIRLLTLLDFSKYQPRLYILAESDKTSDTKICKLEEKAQDVREYSLSKIPRSRNVLQSYSSSIVTTIYATLYTIPAVFKFKPDLIICNGPGTCVPVCLVAFILRALFILNCRIVFVESICRVKTLSLTGKILNFFADFIIVQWPYLTNVCSRARYFGRLT